jgi:3-oxoacyl-[acyl-carrier-protein] synthase II
VRRTRRQLPPHPLQPRWQGCHRAIENGLDDAGRAPDEIDYINAHGTSTPENDKMEYFVVKQIFGDHTANMPISSIKSMIGHTLTAAGAIEAVVSLLTLQHGRIPPTINYDEPDPDIDLDVVPFTAAMQDVGVVMSNSFGFGGQNVSLVFARDLDRSAPETGSQQSNLLKDETLSAQ